VSSGAEVQLDAADFGIAHALDVAAGERLTETGLAMGTPQYISPEKAT
jgi:serine/threonine-protein kinase